MINFGGGIPFFLGIFLVLCGVALYALRSYRPQLARDHDIFFAAISSISGFILMFQGWQLNPILQLGQVAIAGSAVFFAIENIRLRGITTEQAKRNTPIVDDDRPVSRDYDYEDDYGARDSRSRGDYAEFYSRDDRDRSRRIASGRSRRIERDEWRGDYEDAPRRMAPRRDWREDERRYDYEDRPRRRLPRSPRRESEPAIVDATWDEAPRSPNGPRQDSYRAIPPSRESGPNLRRADGYGDRYPSQNSASSSPTNKSYDDEPPVINVSYANYRPTDSNSDADDGEEDNSGYQDFY
ncbi:MAG: Ycf66 family protein [Cyanobacteria bacterium P01_F01_bin.150]